MNSKNREHEFTKRWVEIWLENGASLDYANDVLKVLRARYDEPWRHYHDWGHILDLFDRFSQVEQNLRDPNIVFLDIAYHDAAYDPLSTQKEMLSAQLAKHDLMKVKGMRKYVDCVVGDIIASNTHIVPASLHVDQKNDLGYFLDIDLAGFGDHWDHFVRANQKIRKEYPAVSDDDFIEGSSKVLTNFYERDRIYVTDFFHEKYDTRARANLRRTLDAYKVGKFPQPTLLV